MKTISLSIPEAIQFFRSLKGSNDQHLNGLVQTVQMALGGAGISHEQLQAQLPTPEIERQAKNSFLQQVEGAYQPNLNGVLFMVTPFEAEAVTKQAGCALAA